MIIMGIDPGYALVGFGIIRYDPPRFAPVEYGSITTHTNRSDGSDSPEFVIRLAKQLGLSAVAITDHDYYAAQYDAENLGRSLGMRVINGVECSTFDKARGHKVHILCYNIKHYDAVSELLRRVTKARTDTVFAMLEKVSKLYPITEEMVMDPVALLLSAGSSDENGDIIVCQLAKIFTVTNCELVCKIIVNHTDLCLLLFKRLEQ